MLTKPQIKVANYVIRGMQMDLAASKFSPEFAYRNMNMRITPIKDSVMSSLTNERGNEYSAIRGVGDVEYEKKIRRWYNKICPYDIYKDYYYEDEVSVEGETSSSDNSTGIYYGDDMEGEQPDGDVEGNILGIPIGQGLINNELTIFTTEAEGEIDFPCNEGPYPDFPISDKYWLNELTGLKNNTDRIYKLWFNNKKLNGKLLYKGHLDFDATSPIETLVFYENNNIRKVYWTDGINQPRFINIAAKDKELARWNNKSFDFVRSLRLEENVQIEHLLDGGLFPAAAVQYVCTYFNLFGAESNIFYTSPIYYTRHKDRGASPEENTSNSFRITIRNLDVNFDYIRIYSIVRTSINNVPTVKLVGEISMPLEKKDDTYQITYIDTNIGGTNVDPTEMFYLGGEIITAYTMGQKDNTLFFGNISQKRMSLSEDIKEKLRVFAMNAKPDSNRFKTGFTETYYSRLKFYTKEQKDFKINDVSFKIIDSDWIECSGTRNDYNTVKAETYGDSYFQQDEIYRLGLQFQHYTGKWSDVAWIGDYENNKPVMKAEIWDRQGVNYYGDKWYGAEPRLTFNNEGNGDNSNSMFLSSLIALGYRKVRPVVVYPTINERINIAEGVLNPTMFNYADRANGRCYAMASYFFRPFIMNDINTYADNIRRYKELSIVDNEFDTIVPTLSEMHDVDLGYENIYDVTCDEGIGKTIYAIDQNIVTFNSPDVEFDTELSNIRYDGLELKIIGNVNITSTCCDSDVITSNTAGAYWKPIKVGDTIVRDTKFPPGFWHEKKWYNDGRCNLKSYSYFDNIEDLVNNHENKGADDEAWIYLKSYYFAYPIFVWQQTGSLNNSTNRSDVETYSILKHKKMSYYELGKTNMYGMPKSLYIPNDIKLWNSNENTIIKLDSEIYKGNEDKLITGSDEYSRRVSMVLATHTDEEIEFWRTAKNDAERTKNAFWHEYVYMLYSKYGMVAPMYFDLNVEKYKLVDPEVKEAYDRYQYWNGVYQDVSDMYEEYKAGARRPMVPYATATLVGDDVQMQRITGVVEQLLSAVDTKTIKQINDEFKNINSDKDDLTNSIYKTNPISMKFKSTPHLAIRLENDGGRRRTLAYSNSIDEKEVAFIRYDELLKGERYKSSSLSSMLFEDGKAYLHLAKLTRPKDSIKNRFGGTTDYALSQNKFIPCGEAVDICQFKIDSDGKVERDNDGEALLEVKPKIEIVWSDGDVRMMNYECLKTYPFTLEDENSITERLVFDVETRVNLAGRYDNNRYLETNFVALPTNMNLLNDIYQQKNNFFQYSVEDVNKFSVTDFPNTLTWTKTKIAGDIVDKWTNITMANTMDIDGDKGKITKLLNYNDKLISFQDKGISQILYNEQMQMSTTEGVPIEIANNGKVSGRRYLSEKIGTSNKWSICPTPNNLYFVDDYTKNIWCLGQNGLMSLSDSLGFHTWINRESKTLNPWNPSRFNNIVTYYDTKNKDVLFFTKWECLAYSEYINQFTSFYSYEHSPYYSPLEDRALFLNSYDADNKQYTKSYKVWLQHEGEYNIFFNEYRPFYTTIVANPDEQLDKVFNNFEFRADTWRKTSEEERAEGLPPWVLLEDTFDTFTIVNEYQKKREHMLYHQGMPSNLKKKFRVWRYNIPRDDRHFLDRIRNTWAYMTLEMDQYNTNKTVLHDMAVWYYG